MSSSKRKKEKREKNALMSLDEMHRRRLLIIMFRTTTTRWRWETLKLRCSWSRSYWARKKRLQRKRRQSFQLWTYSRSRSFVVRFWICFSLWNKTILTTTTKVWANLLLIEEEVVGSSGGKGRILLFLLLRRRRLHRAWSFQEKRTRNAWSEKRRTKRSWTKKGMGLATVDRSWRLSPWYSTSWRFPRAVNEHFWTNEGQEVRRWTVRMQLAERADDGFFPKELRAAGKAPERDLSSCPGSGRWPFQVL